MGLADEFERRLERVVEGFFSKAFRSNVEPAEIGRRLMREMENKKTVSVSAVYVPNRYTVALSVVDYQRLEGLVPTLRSEFAGMLESNAAERRWRPAGAMQVGFRPDERLDEGRFEVAAEHDSSVLPAAPARPILVSIGAEPARRWDLGSQRLVVGRLEECDILIQDPSASRRHAELAPRDDGWWITDLGATNGTLVNETLVKERRLHPGDRIRIGSAEFEYREEAGTEG